MQFVAEVVVLFSGMGVSVLLAGLVLNAVFGAVQAGTRDGQPQPRLATPSSPMPSGSSPLAKP